MENKVYDIYCAFTHKLLGTYFNEKTLRNLDKSRCYYKVRVIGGKTVSSNSLKVTGRKPKFEWSVSEKVDSSSYWGSEDSTNSSSPSNSTSCGGSSSSTGSSISSNSTSSSDSSCSSSSSD